MRSDVNKTGKSSGRCNITSSPDANRHFNNIINNRSHLFGALAKLWKEAVELRNVCPSVACTSSWNNSVPTGLIFIKFGIKRSFENLSRKFKFYWNLTTIVGILHEDEYTFLIISRSVTFRMWNVSDKRSRENMKRILCSTPLFQKIVPLMRECRKIR
jgi:hypothetical protein